jgi:hypothetical protein
MTPTIHDLGIDTWINLAAKKSASIGFRGVITVCAAWPAVCTGTFLHAGELQSRRLRPLRKTLTEHIDKCKTDRQFFEVLKEQRPDLLRPHLAPCKARHLASTRSGARGLLPRSAPRRG